MDEAPTKKEQVEKIIIETIESLQVAYDRELRYRLESKFPHDVIAKALKQLVEEGKLKQTNVPGRRGSGDQPNKFYCLPGTNYNAILPTMKRKLDLSIFITGVSREMGRHAELVWWKAFKQNNWNVYPDKEEELQGVRKYKDKKTTLENDIDLIVEKDGIAYGVEVKNTLGYPDDLYWKFIVAAELDTIPLFIARWLNPAQLKIIPQLGGEYLVYRTAIYSTTYADIIKQIVNTLGAPIEARDEIDEQYFQTKINAIHQRTKNSLQEKRRKLRDFLCKDKMNREVRITLGDRRG